MLYEVITQRQDQVPGPGGDEEQGREERRHEPERLPDRPGREQPGTGKVLV